jgi:hypothetical protein
LPRKGRGRGGFVLGDLRFILEGKDKVRNLAVSGVLLCVLGGLLVACQTSPATPTSTPLPAATPTPKPTLTPTPSPTPTLAPTPRPSPRPTLGPLTDAEAVELLEEELVARGVDADTLRIVIKGQPRALSVRYTSAYRLDSNVYRAQTVLIALTVSETALRLQPPVDGGISIGIMPEENGEIGLVAISIGGSSLRAWAEGTLTDVEFVGEWSMGIVPRE